MSVTSWPRFSRRSLVWSPGLRNRDCVQERCGVTDCSGKAAENSEARRFEVEGPARDASPRRLQTDEAAHARWYANGPAAVAALGDRKQAGRDRCRRATTRSPGHPGRIPERAGRRTDVGLGVARQAKLRRRRLAQADRAGGAE